MSKATNENNQSYFFGLLTSISFSGCSNQQKNPAEIYGQKANEIIAQVLKESHCNCLFEIPEKSLIETSNAENPRYDIQSFLIKELKMRNNANLDSLVNASKNFRLNPSILEENNIKTITLKDLLSARNGTGNEALKMCQKGIICIQKPIFDKTYQKAVFVYNDAFSCVRVLPLPVYEFENGRWNRIERK